jgi:hypothetical protein
VNIIGRPHGSIKPCASQLSSPAPRAHVGTLGDSAGQRAIAVARRLARWPTATSG